MAPADKDIRRSYFRRAYLVGDVLRRKGEAQPAEDDVMSLANIEIIPVKPVSARGPVPNGSACHSPPRSGAEARKANRVSWIDEQAGGEHRFREVPPPLGFPLNLPPSSHRRYPDNADPYRSSGRRHSIDSGRAPIHSSRRASRRSSRSGHGHDTSSPRLSYSPLPYPASPYPRPPPSRRNSSFSPLPYPNYRIPKPESSFRTPGTSSTYNRRSPSPLFYRRTPSVLEPVPVHTRRPSELSSQSRRKKTKWPNSSSTSSSRTMSHPKKRRKELRRKKNLLIMRPASTPNTASQGVARMQPPSTRKKSKKKRAIKVKSGKNKKKPPRHWNYVGDPTLKAFRTRQPDPFLSDFHF